MQELNIQELSMAAGGFSLKDVGDAIGRAIDKARDAFGSHAEAHATVSIEHCTTSTTNGVSTQTCEKTTSRIEVGGSAGKGSGGNSNSNNGGGRTTGHR